MSYKISVPGKTFLLGEYLALKGGPAIIVSAGSRFELKVSKGTGLCKNINSKSLAGLWMRANAFDFSDVDVEFIDPYKGRGGFGASSAEFLTVYLWSEFLKNNSTFLNKIDLQALWRSYRQLSLEQGCSTTPSGLDVVAQYLGGITKIAWKDGRLIGATPLKWEFENQSFCLLKTTEKVKTHEHLEQLDLDADDYSDLLNVVDKAGKAFVDGDAFHLLVGLETYYQSLLSRDLVHKNTQNIVKQLNSSNNILGAKGCAALGADVIWVLCETDKIEQLKGFFPVVGLEFVASEADLSIGAQMLADFTDEQVDLDIDLKWAEEKKLKDEERGLNKRSAEEIMTCDEDKLPEALLSTKDSNLQPVEGFGVEGIEFEPDFTQEENL